MVTLLLILLLSSGAAATQIDLNTERGKPSYKFLKLPMHPRSVALSGGGISQSPGEVLSKPLALTESRGPTLSAMRSTLPEQFNASFTGLALALPGGNGWTNGFSGRFLEYADIATTTADAARTGKSYGAYAFQLGFGTARKTKSLAWGASVYYAQSTIETANSHALFSNFASKISLPGGILASARLLNLGIASAFEKEEVILPLVSQVGLSRSITMGDFHLALLADLRHNNDGPLVSVVGSELIYDKSLFLRLSRPFGEEYGAFSAGFALRVAFLEASYAYRGHAVLSGTHTTGIDLLF